MKKKTGTHSPKYGVDIHPVRLNYFSANEYCSPLTTNQHKLNFSITEQGDCSYGEPCTPRRSEFY